MEENEMLDIRLEDNAIRLGKHASVRFQRTLRIPDDGQDYPLPPGLGSFPLRRVEEYRSRVPRSWTDRGGYFTPTAQRGCLLFVDYGQRSRDQELTACRQTLAALNLPNPKIADLSGFGALIHSGLTDPSLNIVEDAFTPGRNMLFLLIAAAYAFQVDADAVSIGLLHESTSLFPDQTSAFLHDAENTIRRCMGRDIKILAPLADFHKAEVVALAEEKGIQYTYSCHMGNEEACGECIACKEFKFKEE
jgi:7-cyano-7-deazaguanine synthase